MANEFVAKNGIIAKANSAITGTLDVSGNITMGTALVATRTWVTSTALSGYATESYVTTAINNLIDAAPGTLDTLNELAAALGDDPNFATTVTNNIATKMPYYHGAIGGDPGTAINGVTRIYPTVNGPFGTGHFTVFTALQDSVNYGWQFTAVGNESYFRSKDTTYGGWHRLWSSFDFSSTNVSNWNAAYNDKINSAAVTGTTTKTLTLTQQDGGTITASWTDYDSDTDAQTLSWEQGTKTLAISGGNDVILEGLATEEYVTSQGYITGESDTLNSVTGRGASTANSITVGSTTINPGYLTLSGASSSVNPELSMTDDSGFGVAGFKMRYGNPDGWTYYDSYWADGGGHRFRTSVASSTIEALTIKNNGNVGINTTNPQYKLDLLGSTDAVVARLSQGYERVRYNSVDLLGYGDGHLWLLGNNNPSLVISSSWDWDQQIEINYVPGSSGAVSGVLSIGQLTGQKNSATYTHGRTDFYVNGAVRSNINTYGVGIGREAASNERFAVNAAEGIWALAAYRSGTIIGGIHTNDSILQIQGDSGKEVRLSTSGNATWNGDVLATRSWVQSQGYLTSETDSQNLEWDSVSKNLTITNGNTVTLDGLLTSEDLDGYGFLTAEADTLATVTARGASTSTRTTFTEVGASRNGSDTIGDGPWFRWTNAAVDRQMLTQLNASNGLTTWAYNGTSWSNIYTLTQGGNVGIGTTSPLSALDVRGNISLDRNRYIFFGGNIGTTGEYIYEKVPGTIAIHSGGSDAIVFPNNSTFIYTPLNIGIGTDSPLHGLHVSKNQNQVAAFQSPNPNTWIDLISTAGTWSMGATASNTWAIYERNQGANATRFEVSSSAAFISGEKVATQSWVSGQGYLTGYTETDTLASVTSRGSSTSNAVTVGGATINGVWQTIISTGGGWNKLSFVASDAWGDGTTYGVLGAGGGAEPGVMTYNQHATWVGDSNGAGIRMGRSGGVAGGAWYQVATMGGDEFMIAKNGQWTNGGLKITAGGELQHGSGNKIWHAGNDGAGSGLDADLLDGIGSGSFLRSDVVDATVSGTILSTNNANVDGANFEVNTTNKTVNEYAYKVSRSGSAVGGIYIDGRGEFPSLTTGGAAITSTSVSNWNTAYGWGNHANYGYWNTDLTDSKDVQSTTVRFAGDVEVQGTFTETSSIRFKENIKTLEPVLGKVEELNPVTYNKIGSEDEEIGLIAEEVAELFPEVVTYNEEGLATGVQYQRLSVILLKAVQELTERVNKLENK